MGELSGDVLIGIVLGFGIAAFLVSIYFLIPIILEKRNKRLEKSKEDKIQSFIE